MGTLPGFYVKTPVWCLLPSFCFLGLFCAFCSLPSGQAELLFGNPGQLLRPSLSCSKVLEWQGQVCGQKGAWLIPNLLWKPISLEVARSLASSSLGHLSSQALPGTAFNPVNHGSEFSVAIFQGLDCSPLPTPSCVILLKQIWWMSYPVRSGAAHIPAPGSLLSKGGTTLVSPDLWGMSFHLWSYFSKTRIMNIPGVSWI